MTSSGPWRGFLENPNPRKTSEKAHRGSWVGKPGAPRLFRPDLHGGCGRLLNMEAGIRHPFRTRGVRVATLLVLFGAACSPSATPPVDAIATTVAQAAFDLLTQTAAAASPTPLPPISTPTALPSETPSLTPTSGEPPRRPQTVNFAACWLGGPGSPNALDSNINKGKAVDLLGLGNAGGWYVIRNPYFHRPCWMLASDLKIFPGTDLSVLPVMTPGIPLMGQ
jgi:hypothetical protein